MNLLAFDTTSHVCSVALMQGEQLLSLHKDAPMQQAGLILPMIQALLDDAKITLSDLDLIAFGCGPGSFTGIRIASSVAQGISFAYDVPIFQISSLAATAQAAYDAYQWPNILVALDARMDQVYWACYEANQQGLVSLVGEEKACSPADLNVLKIKADWKGVGDGWGQYKEQLIKALGFEPKEIEPTLAATAKAVAKLAKAERENGKIGVSAAEVTPVYLR
jgi:tRNA threonylcarbamoyladenosine biosynthesis protein TsaB